MCGRYYRRSDKQRIAKALHLAVLPDGFVLPPADFNVAPTTVAENGGLRLRSGEQRFYEGLVGFRFPMFFSGVADVCEWYDDDAACFRIRVHVENKRWEPLFGYTGSFQVEWRQVGKSGVPIGILPKQVEERE